MATPNNFRVKSGLNVGTTIAGGNTTITGFANVSTSVNSALLTVGSSFIANTSKVAIGTAVGLEANGGIGTAGQVLHSNGTSIYWAADDNAGGTVTSVATANGLSGGPITTTGTLGVTTGSTLTVNTAGIHVNSALAITSLALSGALSGVTTAAMGNTTITGDITVSGNLTINGTTTNINSTNLLVEDKNIILGDVTTPSDVTADGGGITLKGDTDKTFNWVDATDSWTASEHIDLAAGKFYKIGNTTIANSTALGTGILASSLTSVGTLSSLTLGGAASGITTLDAGNTTITGFINVSTTSTFTGVTTHAANVAMANNVLSNPKFISYKEVVVANTITTSTHTIDLSLSNVFDLTLANAAITLSFSNPPASGNAYSFTLYCKQDATGSRVITWPATVKYPNASTPTMSTGANKIDIFSFFTLDGGTIYAGALSLANI